MRYLIGLIVVILAAGGIYFLTQTQKSSAPEMTDKVDPCAVKTITHKSSDNYMRGMIAAGIDVQVTKNQYACNPVKRDDAVLFQPSVKLDPVIRVVRGLPGDKIALQKDPKNKKRWNITINGTELKDINGRYQIRIRQNNPMENYIKAHKGVLKPNDYIVLSFISPGATDSSSLGPVNKDMFIGRVEQPVPAEYRLGGSSSAEPTAQEVPTQPQGK